MPRPEAMQNNSPARNEELIEDVIQIQRTMLQLSWASQRRLAHSLERYDLTLSQYIALKALQRTETKGVTISELASAAQQVSATMTGIIDRLEERGLINRQQDSKDRRAYRISLTSKCLELLEQIDQANLSRTAKILGTFSDSERYQILRFLQIYLDHTLEELENE